MRYLISLYIACVAFLVACGSARSRWPGHDPEAGGDGSYLSNLLSWEIVLGTAAAGICSGLAIVLSSSPVKFAAMWLWAGAAAGACVAILALVLHTALPFLPWVAGGALLISGIVVALHFCHPRESRIEAKAEAIKAKLQKLTHAES